MLVHCNSKHRADEILFLFSNGEFTNRRLEILVCPICENKIARLVQTRISDNKKIDTLYSGKKAKRLIDACRNEVDFSSLDSPKQKKVLYGFRYGENREVVNKKTGESIIIQSAVDFYGNKEKVKQIKQLNDNIYVNG